MSFIYDRLDYILPSSDTSNHDILRLEYLSSCKMMENESNFFKIVPHIPASMFETLLQSVIYKCYLEFINIGDVSIHNFHQFFLSINKKEIVFPESLGLLILNWPKKELILRNNIPSLHPPLEIFENRLGPLPSQEELEYALEDMSNVFQIFCNKLIQFIVKAVFKCASGNTHGLSCNLRRLDVSGLEGICSQENKGIADFKSFSGLVDILEGIRNSTIDTFGHKIDIIVDAKLNMSGRTYEAEFELLSNIIQEGLNPTFGLSVYFNKVIIEEFSAYDVTLSLGLCNTLALGRCEYIELHLVIDKDRSFVENLFKYLPKLVAISMNIINLEFGSNSNKRILDFLSKLEYIECVSIHGKELHCLDELINPISNMKKGLKYLHIPLCYLQGWGLEDLADSIHSDTLLELNLSLNWEEVYHFDSLAEGFVMLFQKLNNIKVLDVNGCYLNELSSHSMSNIVNALKDCVKLECLSMCNDFSLEITNIILDGLAHNISLKYLSLDIPEGRDDLCEKFHKVINKGRNSAIYISWQWQ